MFSFVEEQLQKNYLKLPVIQLLNQNDFNNYCKEFGGICFVAFLPHIYDTTAEERN